MNDNDCVNCVTISKHAYLLEYHDYAKIRISHGCHINRLPLIMRLQRGRCQGVSLYKRTVQK